MANESGLRAAPPAAPLPAGQSGEKTSSANDGIPFLDALPDIQQRLPPLKINLFAYSPNPAERFAIIDMKRYNVGDRIAGGAELMEIRPDTLVLQLDGTPFQVRRP